MMKKVLLLLMPILCLSACKGNSIETSSETPEPQYEFVEKTGFIFNAQKIANDIFNSLKNSPWYDINNPVEEFDFFNNQPINLDELDQYNTFSFDTEVWSTIIQDEASEESYKRFVEKNALENYLNYNIGWFGFPFEDGYYYRDFMCFNERFCGLYYSDDGNKINPAFYKLNKTFMEVNNEPGQNIYQLPAWIHTVKYGSSTAFIMDRQMSSTKFLYLVTLLDSFDYEIYFASDASNPNHPGRLIFIPNNPAFNKKCLSHLSKMEGIHYYNRKSVAYQLRLLES